MIKVLIVGLGGFLGSASRYLVSELSAKFSNNHWFPLGTFTVNVIGCLLIGLFFGYSESRGVLSEELRLFLVVGLLGGFTTFSAFGFETISLHKNVHLLAALSNILLQETLGVSAAWVGYQLTKI